MRAPIALALTAFALVWTHSVQAAPAPASAPVAEVALARYQLGLIYRGPAWTAESSPARDSMMMGHLSNIMSMFQQGSLSAAGPFGDDAGPLGVFVFKGDSVDAIPRLLEGDPMLASQRFRIELFPWLAPPGIGEGYRRRADPAKPIPDSMVTFGMALLRRGPTYTANLTPKVSAVLESHAKYVEQLRADGSLVVAGPVEGTGDLRGVFLFASDSAHVAGLLARDPAIRSGRFVSEIHPWWTAFGVIPGH